MTRAEFIALAVKAIPHPHVAWRSGKIYDALIEEGYEVNLQNDAEKIRL